MFERFARDARAAVALAEQEARELGDGVIGPEHLLVGVLRSAGRDLTALCVGHGLTVEALRLDLAEAGRPDGDSFDADAEALKAIGIDLYAVRENVVRTFGADTFDNAVRRSGRRGRRRGQFAMDRAAKKALEDAQRVTPPHRGKVIGCEHLLLGILCAEDPYTQGIVGAHVSTEQLRVAVEGLLPAA